MRVFLIVLICALILGATIGGSLACDQDILCPAGWMWSDGEGTCVQAPPPTI